MTETNYAKVLYELNIAPEVTASANAILKAAPEVSEVLSSPVVSLKEKENVIDKIFPNLLSLLIIMLFYWLMKVKKVKMQNLFYVTMIAVIALSLLGIV